MILLLQNRRLAENSSHDLNLGCQCDRAMAKSRHGQGETKPRLLLPRSQHQCRFRTGIKTEGGAPGIGELPFDNAPGRLNVVVNWFEEIRRR